MIHAVYVWIGLLAGFLIGCGWCARRIAHLERLLEMAYNAIRVRTEESDPIEGLPRGMSPDAAIVARLRATRLVYKRDPDGTLVPLVGLDDLNTLWPPEAL